MTENSTPADWADLPYFLAISRSGSLRAAAQSLGATHATVNRRIRALEESYGVQLYERSVEGLRLTAAGEALLPLAQEAERAVLAARRTLSGLDGEAAGIVRVSLPMFLVPDVLTPIFSEFIQTYPDIELEIIVTDRMQDLTRHEADVSIRVAYSVTDDVIGRRVLQYTRGVFAARSYVERVFPDAGPKGEGLTWLGWGDSEPLPDWLRKSPFPKADLRHSVADGVFNMHLVQAGAGMSYLPTFVQHFIPDLVQLPGTKVELDRSIWLLLHSDLRKTKRVRVLVDFLADRIGAMKDIFIDPRA